MSEGDAVTTDFAKRAALRIEEAAESVGLSERAFRDHLLPRCPKFHAGTAVRIPTQLFLEFIAGLALEEQQSSQESAAELLTRIRSR